MKGAGLTNQNKIKGRENRSKDFLKGGKVFEMPAAKEE